MMKKTVRNLLTKLKNRNWAVIALNAMALLTVIQNVNAGCGWIDHQPVIPEEAKRFKRF